MTPERSQPAETLLRHVLEPERRHWNTLWPAMLDVHRAHNIMLAERRLLAPGDAAAVAAALAQLERAGIDSLQAQRDDDLFFATEKAIDARTGGAGGRLHLGRSRNDINATLVRMLARDQVLGTFEGNLALQRTLLDLAAEHAETLMPGMTHRQIAQPITLGFWFLATAAGLERDQLRLQGIYDRVNRSPLGAAAFAGTRVPIDRQRTAALLGFGGIVEHALDAVAGRDVLIEVVFAECLQGLGLSRMANELIWWNSGLVHMAEVADGYAGISSIMPQKKNPVALEHCRAWTGLLMGELTALLGVSRATFIEHCRDWGEMLAPLIRAFETSRALLVLLRENLLALRVSPPRMAALAAAGFSTSTDVADLLALRNGWSFRQAHAVVAQAVQLTMARDPAAASPSLETLDEASRALYGVPTGLEATDLAGLVDPAAAVGARISAGGTAPGEVRRLRDHYARLHEQVAAWVRQQQTALLTAQANLRQTSEALEHSSPGR